MSYLDLKRTILDTGLCTGCGACVAACPPDLLRIDTDDPRPSLAGTAGPPGAACAGCTLCTDVCPGRDTDVPESERRLFGRTRDPQERWTGVIGSVHIATARAEPVRSAASAGGAATGLLVSSLQSGRIDAALVIGRDEERPWVPVPVLATTADEVIRSAQANYCIVPNLQLLRDAPYRRIGVVGLACEVQALRKMRTAGAPEAVLDKIAFVVELACASNTTLDGTRHLIENRLRLPLTSVTKMRYRDGEYPGEFTAWDDSGRPHRLPFHELVTEFKKFKTFRCLSCPDWWSGLADISVADGDPNIFRTSRDVVAMEQSSLVVVRTPLGAEVLAEAVATGHLSAVEAEFDQDKSLGLQRKRHRSQVYRETYGDRVPTSPVSREEEWFEAPLDDDTVIEQMSSSR